MTVYMLLNVVALLFFTPNHPITIKFSENIEFYNIGNEGDFYSYKSKNGKMLVIKPMIKSFDVPLVVITENHNYQFQIKNATENVPPLVIIENGEIDKIYTAKVKEPNYKILEGDHSLQIIKQSGDLNVNGFVQTEYRKYYPKGAPILVNGKKYF